MIKTTRQVAGGATVLLLLAALSLNANPVTVQEIGVGPHEIVSINSSTLGNNLWVYACVVKLLVNGKPTEGFCIDPWHWSVSGPQSYNMVPLSNAPKAPGPMGGSTALQIEQLWQNYYTPNLSNTTAAGLQIAIWDLLSASIAPINGATFSLNGPNDYGAAGMISWVDKNPGAPAAALFAVTGPTGQDYVIPDPPSVPDDGFTVGMIGIGLLGLVLSRVFKPQTWASRGQR